jgi:hypothetical protein
MTYLFMTGAPGSRWSGVSQYLGESPGIDTGDYSPHRQYFHESIRRHRHFGSYFGPQLEFGHWFDALSNRSKADAELEFNRPWDDQPMAGLRIIKSYVFAYHLDYLRVTWPSCPLVLVYRPDDQCLDWWLNYGGFDISYPDYSWYANVDNISKHIAKQNQHIKEFVQAHGLRFDVVDTDDLCARLQIPNPKQRYPSYADLDLKVAVNL